MLGALGNSEGRKLRRKPVKTVDVTAPVPWPADGNYKAVSEAKRGGELVQTITTFKPVMWKRWW